MTLFLMPGEDGKEQTKQSPTTLARMKKSLGKELGPVLFRVINCPTLPLT